MTPQEFIDRWKGSGGGELANSQSFLKELCALLDVAQPEPTQTDETLNSYVFEKAVLFNNGDGTFSSGRVDLYRQGCFVLESKQGSERKAAELAALATVTRQKKLRTGTAERGTPAWDLAMTRARQQAKRYAEALPEWPPFLVVVDVGHCFDLYADFSQTGKNYVPFPDPQNYRIPLTRLAHDEVRQTLRALWTDPHALDPSRRAAKVTRDLAAKLAELAKRLEAQTDELNKGDWLPPDSQDPATISPARVPVPFVQRKRYTPDQVAQFLMRCLFTMFAEDVELIGAPDRTEPGRRPEGKFTALLKSLRETPHDFVPMVENLWQTMNAGGFSPVLREHVKRFNGGLFEDCTALPLDRDQLELLIEAAEAHWSDVEPAIFGTLLERALDVHERHKLGAHFTPRAYVERLVMPTLIEPLREEWDDAYATAVQLHSEGDPAAARRTVRRFHERLCEVRVLDPACGSGNFLYVALELIKRLEGEVLNALREFGEKQLPLLTVDPHQFLGIEVNPRAAAITDLVLWIGYLQWHFRTRGREPLNEPIIRKFHNIESRDAVLTWDAVQPVTDDQGRPVTRWDGRTTKPHPVTDEEVPDESAQVQELRYINPRKAEWPKADYIVGNPPFIGGWKLRQAKGDGYVTALWSVYDDIPPKADYVMFWWDQGAENVRIRGVRRFGFITTNSITQVFQRRVLARHLSATKSPLRLCFAVPDHPWVDDETAAAVRIAMTVGTCTQDAPTRIGACLQGETDESATSVVYREVEVINPTLTAGTNLDSAIELRANAMVCSPGVQLYGSGFILNEEEAQRFHSTAQTADAKRTVRKYVNGRDLMGTSRGAYVIDFFGHTKESAALTHPAAFQRVLTRVKPERDQNRRESIRTIWWRFGWERPKLRAAIDGLLRYIVTPETSKHRIFVFLDAETLPDNMLNVFAFDDAYFLGVLSSRIHVTWALHTGGRLEDRPRYNKTRCFETFPFPDPDDAVKQRIRELAEQLDAHRKRQQGLHPGLTMTGMYNVLDKLRSGEPLTPKEQQVHEQGLVSVLRQIHDDLDAAVFDAYGWPHDLSDEDLLARLVELNRERAAEESRGHVRWLRPDFQNPTGPRPVQTDLALPTDPDDEPLTPQPAAKPKKTPWPKTLPDRIRAVRTALTTHPGPATVEEIAATFTRARKPDVAELLETLVAIGQARQTDNSHYVP